MPRGFRSYQEVDPSSPAYRGPMGKRRLEADKYKVSQFNAIQKDLYNRTANEQTAAEKSAESKRRFTETQGAINKRAFRPYEMATKGAYNLLSTTPTVKRAEVPGEPPIRSELTRAESKRMLLERFPKADFDNASIKELLGKRPENINDVPLEKPVDWQARAAAMNGGGGSMLGDLQNFMKGVVSKGVAGLRGMMSSKAPSSVPSVEEQIKTLPGQAPDEQAAEATPQEVAAQAMPQEAAAQSIPDFESPEHAESANLPRGTSITIKGRKAVIE